MRIARTLSWLALGLIVGLALLPHTAAAAPPDAGPVLTQATDSLPPVPGEITDLLSKGWFLLIGSIASAVFGVLKLASAKVNGLSGPIKAILMYGLTFVAMFLTKAIGVEIPPDILSVGFGTVAAALAAVAGMGIRALLKAFGLSKFLDKAVATS